MKYSEYLKINDSFQYSINLQFDINNINKIKDYIPTTDSCEVMEYYFDSLLGNFSKSTTLIGPYGKGKSHLMLIFLTLLNDYNDEDEEILNHLIEKIKIKNIELYHKIHKIRDNKQKYLPVIINSNYNDINQAFLLGMKEALERDKISNIKLDTYFTLALDMLAKWKKDNDNEILEKFDICLSAHNMSIKELEFQLKMYSEKGYKIFKEVYQCVMHGMEFNPIVNTDIVKYYKDVNYKISELGYHGMIVIFDEFSKFLEYVGNENMMKDLKIIQDFAEMASRSGKREQVIFTCVTHKTFNEYINNFRDEKLNAFKTVEGRFKEVYFNRSMEQNYEIVSQTIVKTNRASTYIKKYIENQRKFYDRLLEIYKFCRFKNVEEILFEGCFPLNPITVYAVINLSEKIAQNERTLFTFLTDDDTNSFKHFINSDNDGNTLFNLEKVYDYFYNILRKENDERIKETWIKAETSLSKVDNEDEKKILKSLAVIYMLNNFDELKPNQETLYLALDIEKSRFDYLLNHLFDIGVLKLKKSNKLIDFSTVYNKEVLHQIKKLAEIKFSKINIRESLNSVINLGYIIPRRYNQNYKMTRFFKMKFITEEELLNIKSFQIIKEEDFCDGVILNVIKTTANDEALLNKVSQINDEKVIVRIPKGIITSEFMDTLKEFEALRYIKKTENNEEEITRELNLIEEDYSELIQKEITKKFEELQYVIYQQRMVKNENLSNLCSQICEEIYNKCPIINNELINREIVSKPMEKAINIVMNAVLYNDKSKIKTETSAEATIYKAVINKKQNEDIKEVIHLIRQYIKDTEKTGKRSFDELTSVLTNVPFGIRKGIIPLLLSIAIEDYGGNIILYFQNKEIDLSAENISKIVDEPEKYYLIVEKGTEEKHSFIKGLAEVFQSEYTEIERNNIKNVVSKMKIWVLGLPRIARELNVANNILKKQEYIEIRNKLLTENINNNEFLFIDTTQIFHTNDFKMILQDFISLKETYDHYVLLYIESLIPELKERFEHSSKSNLKIILSNWYKNMDETIKQTVISYECKELFEYVSEIDTYNDAEIFQKLSYIFTGTYVEDWMQNTETIFFENLNKTLELIRDAKNENTKTDKEMVSILDGGKKITKYINNSEISAIGTTLKNNIEDSIEEYGDSVDESEKIKILLEILKKYM